MNLTPHPNFLHLISLRSKILFAIETYFQHHNYIGVHTPSLSSWLIPERHIDVYSVCDTPESIDDIPTHPHACYKKKYLVPSPELYLKTLLACMSHAYLNTEFQPPHIYELSHSFRRSEVEDKIHSNEFLMLEWYTAQASLHDSLHICGELIEHAISVLQDDTPPWAHHNAVSHPYIFRVEELFERYAGINLRTLIQCESGIEAAQYAGIVDNNSSLVYDDWEDVFHFLLVDRIEPYLPHDKPVFLTYYPSRIETLAKTSSQDSLWSERWELYIQGLEIANCYVEETNPQQISAYMTSQIATIAHGNTNRNSGVPWYTSFLQTQTLPLYSGVALGIDRLIACILSHKMGSSISLDCVSPLSFLQ